MGSYETVYGVGLLDDLHNYFPALLYEHGRFQSVQQVLQYIRMQTAQRFNLFSYGAEQYRANLQQIPIVHRFGDSPLQAEQRQPPLTPVPEQSIPPPIRTGQPVQSIRVVNMWDDREMSMTNDLLSLLGASLQTTPLLSSRVMRAAPRLNANATPFMSSFLQPIAVRPTGRVIEENSEILTGISGRSCAICQEDITESATCRRLRACQHTYHRTCIDRWFEQSVQCPTCRHDIRENTSSQ